MANKDFYIAKMNAALNELAWAKKGLHSDPADGDKASFTVADQLLDELLDVAMRRSISFAELNDLNRDIGI
ncbi:hypothetical protein ORI99_10155 [Alishewanella sp. SMS9]|nr:hypothetical protein [Alishewanella sp. SMS9]